MPSASEALQAGAQFGPSIWFAVFIVVMLVACGAAFMRYVHLPHQKAAEENNSRLADVVEKLSVIADRTDTRTAATHEHVMETKHLATATVAAMLSLSAAASKVARAANIDIQTELAEASSVLRFVRGGFEPVKSDAKPG